MPVEQLGLADANILSVPMSKDALAEEDIQRKLGGDAGNRADGEDYVPPPHDDTRRPGRGKRPSCVDSFSGCTGCSAERKECSSGSACGGFGMQASDATPLSGKHDFYCEPPAASGFRSFQAVGADDNYSEDEPSERTSGLRWVKCEGCGTSQCGSVEACGACEAATQQEGARGENRSSSHQQTESGTSERLRGQGWRSTGRGTWTQISSQAGNMVDVPGIKLKRRTTRDSDTGVVMEDLRFKPSTPERIRRRALRRSRNLQVVIELEEDVETVQAESDEMDPAEASRYRAATARFNFLPQDRPHLQSTSNECSRRIPQPRACDWETLRMQYDTSRAARDWRTCLHGKPCHPDLIFAATVIGRSAGCLARVPRAAPCSTAIVS